MHPLFNSFFVVMFNCFSLSCLSNNGVSYTWKEMSGVKFQILNIFELDFLSLPIIVQKVPDFICLHFVNFDVS